MADDLFLKIRSFEFHPVYMSLGLPSSMFRAGQGADSLRGSLTALNGPGDILWLFRGSDYYTYNLRTRKIERGPEAIEQHWTITATNKLPQSFKSGIDAAVWAGEEFSRSFYFFKANQFIRLNRPRQLLNPHLPPTFPQHLPRPERLMSVDEGPSEMEMRPRYHASPRESFAAGTL